MLPQRTVTKRNNTLILIRKLLNLTVLDLLQPEHTAVKLHIPVPRPVDRILSDPGIPLAQLLPQNRLKIIVSLDDKRQMIPVIRIDPHRNAIQHILQQQNQQHGKSRHDIHPRTDRKPEPRSHPDARRRRQPLDISADFDDHAGTQKRNTADSLRGDPRRVRPFRPVKLHNFCRSHVRKSVL